MIGHRIYGGGSRSGEVFYTVDGLQPDTRYVFLLRAENPEGLSPASPVSEVMRTRPDFRRTADEEDIDEDEARNQLSSSEIELISSEPASSTSIRISWKVRIAKFMASLHRHILPYINRYYFHYIHRLSYPTPQSNLYRISATRSRSLDLRA